MALVIAMRTGQEGSGSGAGLDLGPAQDILRATRGQEGGRVEVKRLEKQAVFRGGQAGLLG